MNKEKLMQHEYDRIAEMDDKQLYTRYKKMVKPEKIGAFRKALKKTDRHPALQKIVDKALGVINEEEWFLLHPDGKSYRFVTKPNNPDEIAIFLTKVGSQEDRFMPHCLLKKARELWDELIEEGCTQVI